jgi:hypothetical protein
MTPLDAVLVSFLAEMFESAWQYSPDMKGLLYRVYLWYRRSILLFFAMHTGYLFVLFLSLYYDLLNLPIVVMLIFKTLDIFSKIELVKTVFVYKRIDERVEAIISMKIPPWLFAIGPLTYPWLVYVALGW